MEYMGATQTASYMSGPKLGGSGAPTFLPAIGTQKTTYSYDTYPAPSPLRRSQTTMPYRPGAYYQTAKVNPAAALNRSMPDPLSMRSSMSDLDSIKVPPVFAAARNALYTRYSPGDWSNSNASNYLSSDRTRGAAERLRQESTRLAREADDRTKRAQSEVGKRLGERLSDIQFWKNELQHETDEMITETNSLLEAKRILEKSLAETENPLHVAQECLYNREKRQAIDLVHDEVERELIREVDVIKKAQERMRQTVERANTQLSLDRAAQHELEKDTGDKFQAQGLDDQCHQLNNTARGIAYHNGVERVDNTVSVPETWAKFSNDNIQRSQSERAASKQMRNEIDTCLNQTYTEIRDAWNRVNAAFTRRVQETTDARNKLQNHLSRVLQEIRDMENNIAFLKKAISDKVAPMQVAQTRLDTRVRRPNVELCRDPVQHRLVEEVHEINETVDQLQRKLREAENALQQLLRTKAALEQDLSVKNNSLFIDREKCMGMRKTLPHTLRIVQV